MDGDPSKDIKAEIIKEFSELLEQQLDHTVRAAPLATPNPVCARVPMRTVGSVTGVGLWRQERPVLE
jgi:hypothetical protein